MSDRPPKPAKPVRKPRSRGWRIFFAIFKWCRVAVLLAVFSLILALLFLHQAGLPVSLQDRLIARFRDLGWEAQFSTLRLRWYGGVVAEELSLSSLAPGGPHLFVDHAEFRLSTPALRSFQVQFESLLLSDGRLVLPLPATNGPGRTFVLERIHGDLRLHPGDHWELRSLEGEALGCRIRVRGDLTNALLVRQWKLPRPQPRESTGSGGQFWSELVTRVRQVRPVVPPQWQVQFSADGRDPRSLEATVKLIAPGLESPWGGLTNLNLVARLQPAPATNAPPQAGIELIAGPVHTPWGNVGDVHFSAAWEPSLDRVLPTNTQCLLEVRQPRTPWGRADHVVVEGRTVAAEGGAETRLVLQVGQPDTRAGRARLVRLEAQAAHASDRPLPATWRLEAVLDQAFTPWATSAWTRAEGRFQLPARESWRLFDPTVPWPERGAGIEGSVACVLSNVLAPEFAFSRVLVTNHWRETELRVGFSGDSSAGGVAGNVSLDIPRRTARVNSTLRADPRPFARFLPAEARGWLEGFEAAVAPEFQVVASVTLPAWTNAAPDWGGEVWPSLSMAARVECGEGAYRQVGFTGMRVIGLYTNGQWTVPEARVTRPEGAVEAEAMADTGTADFRLKFTSTMAPHALRPAFGETIHRQVFDPFAFPVPPYLRGEVHGNWRDWSTLAGVADAAVTNASVRTQAIAYASAHAEFTNGFLSLLQPVVLREGERGEAEGIGLDTRTQRLYLTNAQGNLNPMALAHALGPPIVRVLRPYVFEVPPRVRAHGLLPLRHGDNGEDAWFEVEGGAFHWERFHADAVRARIHWLGEEKTVTLTNLAARWRGADVAGWLRLDFTQPKGGGLSLHAALEGAELGPVVRDLQGGRTNRLEGTFGGELNVTGAFLDDPSSWQGHGRVDLREGLLWDIPLFAVVSPVLNRIIPGLGHSRAREGRATFTITNSVIHSRDLEIRASAMQLQYRGTVDFQGAVDARMEAELFRNVPGLGLVLSKVLWPVTKLFEYRVTGTLENPKLDEMYFVPKVVLFPLQPVKTLKDLFGPEKSRQEKAEPPPAPNPAPAPDPAPAPAPPPVPPPEKPGSPASP